MSIDPLSGMDKFHQLRPDQNAALDHVVRSPQPRWLALQDIETHLLRSNFSSLSPRAGRAHLNRRFIEDEKGVRDEGLLFLRVPATDLVVVLADVALGFKARGWNYWLRALVVEMCNSDGEYRCEVRVRQRVISTSESAQVVSTGTVCDMNCFHCGRLSAYAIKCEE